MGSRAMSAFSTSINTVKLHIEFEFLHPLHTVYNPLQPNTHASGVHQAVVVRAVVARAVARAVAAKVVVVTLVEARAAVARARW